MLGKVFWHGRDSDTRFTNLTKLSRKYLEFFHITVIPESFQLNTDTILHDIPKVIVYIFAIINFISVISLE